LALPILLLLMLGTVDLGRMFFDYIDLRNAAREGAGYGAHFPADTAGITTRVTRHGIPGGTIVTISCTDCATSGGVATGSGTIKVTATHTFTPIASGFLSAFFGIGSVSLSASASMRVLN